MTETKLVRFCNMLHEFVKLDVITKYSGNDTGVDIEWSPRFLKFIPKHVEKVMISSKRLLELMYPKAIVTNNDSKRLALITLIRDYTRENGNEFNSDATKYNGLLDVFTRVVNSPL